MARILVNNAVVGQFIGDTFVNEVRVGNRKRTYVFSRDRLTVTVGSVTEEIELPWVKREEAA